MLNKTYAIHLTLLTVHLSLDKTDIKIFHDKMYQMNKVFLQENLYFSDKNKACKNSAEKFDGEY